MTLLPTTFAVIYARYSDPHQGKGTSIARQLSDCRAHCAMNGWTVEFELIDRGRSAYTGKNRHDDAALGQFLAEALDGLHVGKILIVERLDRLSRQGHDDTYSLIKSLTDSGVSVVTVDGSAFYRAKEKLDLTQVITILIKAETAHEESVAKSRRVRDGKARRRQDARDSGRIFTKNGPPWLTVTNDKWAERAGRLNTLKTIFQMADEGAGKMTLSRHFNAIDPEGWGGKGWHPSFIVRLLSNRAVLGEYQPYESIAGKRVPSGEPIMDYYPSVIDSDLFQRVNAQAASRKTVSGGRKGASTIANLVSGLAKCAECGASMKYRSRAAEGVIRRVNGKEYVKPHADASLLCSAADRRHGCTNQAGIAYHTFEKALLDSVLHLALDDQAFSNRGEVGRLNKTIAERQRELEIVNQRAETLWSAYADNASDIAAKLARVAEAEAKEIRENVAALQGQLEQARGRVSSAEHLARVADIRSSLYHEDMAVRVPLRRKVAQSFQTVITSVSCDAERIATVVLAGGLAALQIQRGNVIRQANAVRAFSDGRFSSLVPRNAINARAIPDVMRRLEKTLVENGSLKSRCA